MREMSRYDLEHIARYDSNSDVRIAAVKQLSSRDSEYELEHIARYDSNHGVRIAAVKQLSSRDSEYELEHIARYDSNPDVRIAAVKQLSSRDSEYELEHIARYDPDPRVRMAALGEKIEIEDQYIIKEESGVFNDEYYEPESETYDSGGIFRSEKLKEAKEETNPLFKSSKIDSAILSDDKLLKDDYGRKVGTLRKHYYLTTK